MNAECYNRNLTTVPSGIPKTTIRWAMTNNQITTIEENDFQGFTVLSILNMNNNQITLLPANVFRGLTSLTLLILDDNQISAIDATAFQGLTAVQQLWMRNNYLTVVDGQMFEALTSIWEILLDDNPLDCSNCRLKSFRDFLRDHPRLGNSLSMCDDTVLIINHNFTDCKGHEDSKSTTNLPSVLLLVVSLYLSLSSLIFFNFPVIKRG